MNHECTVRGATYVELHPINALRFRRQERGNRVLAFMRVQPPVRENLNHQTSVPELSWTAHQRLTHRILSISFGNPRFFGPASAARVRFGCHDHFRRGVLHRT